MPRIFKRILTLQRKRLIVTSDTIMQKYIYNTSYDDNDFPLVLEDNIDIEKDKCTSINASYLYCLEEQDFIRIVQNIEINNIDKIIIKNDYCFKNSNKILINASLSHILSFAYLFKKKRFKCKVI